MQLSNARFWQNIWNEKGNRERKRLLRELLEGTVKFEQPTAGQFETLEQTNTGRGPRHSSFKSEFDGRYTARNGRRNIGEHTGDLIIECTRSPATFLTESLAHEGE